MANFQIPYSPNPIQAKIHQSLKRFNVVVLHRGAGKSYLAVNELIRRAIECPSEDGALFVYIAPEKQQAKDIIWTKLKYFLKNVKDLKIREDELTVTFPHNNASIRLEGSDRPDRLRGIHPHFVVLDEVGQMKRDTWYEAVFPSIQRNNGSVLFIGTPKGENLFKELFDLGNHLTETEQDDRWYTTIQNVVNAGVYNSEWIKLNKPLMPEAKWNQEYMCDWAAVFTGAYYADLLLDPTMSIISDVPFDPMYPVITGWDIGIKDPTCIWFCQKRDGKYNFIDYFESTNKDIFAIINMLKAKPYRYSYHIIPHDSSARSFIDLKTTSLSILRGAFGHQGVVQTRKPYNTAATLEGINVTHNNLYISRFDKKKCAKGLDSLKTYRAEVDKVTGELKDIPSHHKSDAADALRTFFTGLKNHDDGTFASSYRKRSPEAEHEYNYFEW